MDFYLGLIQIIGVHTLLGLSAYCVLLTGLREAHLAGQQHAISGQAEQGVDADDLNEAEIEVHSPLRGSIASGRRRKQTAGSEDEECEQQEHDIEVALRDAAQELDEI